MTKREAQEAEAEFLIKSQDEANVSALNLKQLIDLFIENRSTIVKDITMYNYKGDNINTVSQFLGRFKIKETLNTYTHLYKNALTDIASLINEMNEGQINS